MEMEERVIEILRGVIDPEVGINIVDLGLIYDIKISDGEIIIIMTLTTPGCPMHNSITEWTRNSVKSAFPDKDVNIDLVWEPAWTPELMSEEAKEMLGR